MRIYRYCYKLKTYQLIALGILLPFIFKIILNVVIDFLCNSLHLVVEGISDEQLRVTIFKIVSAIAFAPLIETFLFQYFPLKSGHHLFKRYKYHYHVIILLSAIAFAAVHQFINPFNFASKLFAGLIWAFICLIFIRKKRHPILYIALIHAIVNSITLVMRLFVLDFNLIK